MEQAGDVSNTTDQNHSEELKKLTPLGELLGKAFKRSVKIFPPAFAIFAIIGLIILAGAGLCVGSVFLFKIFWPVFVIAAVLFAGYACFWLYTSVIALICNSADEVKIKETLKTGWRLTAPYLVASTWAGLIMAGGFICFIAPGIIYFVWFLFVPFVLVAENIKGRSALVRSKNLVKGYWFPVFGRILVIVILGAVISALNGFPRGAASSINVFWLIVNVLLTVFLQIFTPVYMYLIYKDLCEIKGPSTEDELKGFPKNRTGWLVAIAGLIIFIAYSVIVGIGISKKALAKKSPSSTASYPSAGYDSCR